VGLIPNLLPSADGVASAGRRKAPTAQRPTAEEGRRHQGLGWRQDNRNRSNQESKFDFLATHQCLVKIDATLAIIIYLFGHISQIAETISQIVVCHGFGRFQGI